MNQVLSDSIVKTLAYFDIFDHPLTKEELFKFLWKPPKIAYIDFLEELDDIINNNINLENGRNGEMEKYKIRYKDSFFFLSGRKKIIKIRKSKTVDNDKKRKIVIRAVKKIRYVPFVKAVLLCNNSSFEMAKENSDIDVVIIIKHKRLWIGRLLVTLLLSLFRLRRNKIKITNRICLSFYTTDINLDFSKLTITNPDIGLAYWIMQFSSLYDPENFCSQLKKSNVWIKPYLPNAFLEINKIGFSPVNDNWLSLIGKKFWQTAWSGVYGDMIEKQARAAQKAKMRRNIHSVQDKPDSRVIISDKMLKFHENDRRQEFKEKWENNFL